MFLGSVIDVATIKPALEVADIFRLHFDEYLQGHNCTAEEFAAVNAIIKCRTAALGGHLRECERCKKIQIAYNSCNNRNCPKCGGTVGVYSVYLYKYIVDGKERETIPSNIFETGIRKIKISCKAKTDKGSGYLYYRIVEVQTDGRFSEHIETKNIGRIECKKWTEIEILFRISPNINSRVGFLYYGISEENILLIQNLVISDKFVD